MFYGNPLENPAIPSFFRRPWGKIALDKRELKNSWQFVFSLIGACISSMFALIYLIIYFSPFKKLLIENIADALVIFSVATIFSFLILFLRGSVPNHWKVAYLRVRLLRLLKRNCLSEEDATLYASTEYMEKRIEEILIEQEEKLQEYCESNFFDYCPFFCAPGISQWYQQEKFTAF